MRTELKLGLFFMTLSIGMYAGGTYSVVTDGFTQNREGLQWFLTAFSNTIIGVIFVILSTLPPPPKPDPKSMTVAALRAELKALQAELSESDEELKGVKLDVIEELLSTPREGDGSTYEDKVASLKKRLDKIVVDIPQDGFVNYIKFMEIVVLVANRDNLVKEVTRARSVVGYVKSSLDKKEEDNKMCSDKAKGVESVVTLREQADAAEAAAVVGCMNGMNEENKYLEKAKELLTGGTAQV